MSRGRSLLPADVVLTGTPWGCGAFKDSPRGLRDGDAVPVEVEAVGVLRNQIQVERSLGTRDQEGIS